MAKSNDITISNTGTAPKYKISFANQAAASKETRVEGVALLVLINNTKRKNYKCHI